MKEMRHCKYCYKKFLPNKKEKIYCSQKCRIIFTKYMKSYRKIYCQKNRKKVLLSISKYRSSLKGKQTIKKNNKSSYSKRKENRKWVLHYYSARRRCNNPNIDKYKYYGGRGIKFLMALKDLKFLWFRDKAYLMEQPSIDRKNNDGNYTLENCRFIEMIENIKRSKK